MKLSVLNGSEMNRTQLKNTKSNIICSSVPVKKNLTYSAGYRSSFKIFLTRLTLLVCSSTSGLHYESEINCITISLSFSC